MAERSRTAERMLVSNTAQPGYTADVLTLCFCLRHLSHALLTRVGCRRVELMIGDG